MGCLPGVCYPTVLDCDNVPKYRRVLSSVDWIFRGSCLPGWSGGQQRRARHPADGYNRLTCIISCAVSSRRFVNKVATVLASFNAHKT